MENVLSLSRAEMADVRAPLLMKHNSPCSGAIASCVKSNGGGKSGGGDQLTKPMSQPCLWVGYKDGGGDAGGRDSRCVQKYIICGLDCPHI